MVPQQPHHHNQQSSPENNSILNYVINCRNGTIGKLWILQNEVKKILIYAEVLFGYLNNRLSDVMTSLGSIYIYVE